MSDHQDHGVGGTLHLVAVHIVARARAQATGRFSLRVTPGGFGTPDFGPEPRRIRVSGDRLVVESDEPGEASARSVPIGGATLRDLAAEAGVDLDAPLDVGHDTPPLGSPDAILDLTSTATSSIHRVHAIGAAALDETTATLHDQGRPATLPRLWPEHFDVAIEAGTGSGTTLNLGVSPGDGFHADPYAYVGPWTDERPGDPDYWNAPFGAFRPLDDDPPRLAAFWLDGCRRFS